VQLCDPNLRRLGGHGLPQQRRLARRQQAGRVVGPEGWTGLVDAERAQVALPEEALIAAGGSVARSTLGQVRLLSSGPPRVPAPRPSDSVPVGEDSVTRRHHATHETCVGESFSQMAISLSRGYHSDISKERTNQLAASPPMFESRFLDFFTRVHPAMPAIVFVPVVVAGIWLGLDRGLSAGTVVLLFGAGLVIWTPTEYWLHRLVFHWQPKFRGGDRLHFMIHGVHHDHPNDAMRLVMPPAAAIPLAALFLGLFVLILGDPHAFPTFSGFIAGYLVYDYTHYHVHHHTPKTKLGRQLREQHMRHHFQDHHYGFGVSSPLWDVVFRTLPRRRKADRP
jgi:sterol desaturase/sphingolipid hydroxylase (fatty acid hydroxylase superfamily)